jgi:molecular chaperone DnaK
MSEGSGTPPPGQPAGGKRPAIGLQIKLPCASLDDVKARYADELRQNQFFIRTRTPRPKDTLVRLEARLASGDPGFRAAAMVCEVTDTGIRLRLLSVDEAAAAMIAELGGTPPPTFKADPAHAPPGSGALAQRRPDLSTLKGITPPPSPFSRPVPPPPPPDAMPARAVPPPLPPDAMPFRVPPPPPPDAMPFRASTRPAEPKLPPPVMTQPPPKAAASAPAEAPAPPAKAAIKGAMIGIDLGTTNSAAAAVKDGKPFVIPSREGHNIIPSIVAINDKGNLIVGHPAKSQLLINPGNTVYGSKRLVGRQFESPAVRDLMGRFPYQIVAGARGEAAVQLGDRQFSLQQISALVLAEVKGVAQQWLKTEVNRAVITVPAYYNDNQRQAVREAGELAGLHVERILNEPTAAALAFGHGKQLEKRILVYDLGGGTFDASVLELNGNVYEVVSTGGDTFLGGVDFDKVIVDHLLKGFEEEHGIQFPGDRVALQRVTDAAERAKIALSEQLEVKVMVPFVALVGQKPYDLAATLTRAELVALAGHLVDRTLSVCQEVLAARELKVEDLDDVLLVGGQSRMPLVRERIREFFGKEPSKAVHPDEAVALGAAVLAHSMDTDDMDAVVLIDVLPMSIGVGLPGGRFRKIIERNTKLPHKKAIGITTTRENQPSIEILIFQGESEKAQENEYLGTLLVPGLPRGPRGSQDYEILFALSPESILTVTAKDKKSDRLVVANFSTRSTPEEVRARLAEVPVTDTRAVPQPNGGVLGWFKRLFSGGEARG